MRGTVLKILATLAFAAVVFPFMFACDINTYGNISALRMLFYYGIGAAVFLLGYVSAQASKAHRKLRIPLRAAGFLCFGAGFLSLLITGDGVTVFAFGVCCVFAYFIGERAGYKNFADMFPMSAFAFYIFLTIGCYIFVRVAANEDINTAAADTVVAAFAVEFTCAALLVNQSGIFDRANMRKETKSSLPKGLTAYNAALILGFTVTALVLLIFRKQLAWLLTEAIMALVRVMMWFMSLFHAEPMTIETPEGGELGPGWIFYEYSWYIAEAFGIISLIALAVIFRKKIFAAIKGFFARLGAFFSGRPEESEHPEFIDVFENYSSGRRNGFTGDNVYAVQRKYKSETDPVKRFRYGYRILLFRIKAVNQRLTPADTVSVQAQRGEARFGHDEMQSAAMTYDGVRYGGQVPDGEQLSQLDDMISR